MQSNPIINKVKVFINKKYERISNCQKYPRIINKLKYPRIFNMEKYPKLFTEQKYPPIKKIRIINEEDF